MAIGLGAMAGDFIVPALLSLGYPGYSHLTDTVSTLGAETSPVRWGLSAWLVAEGIAFLVFGVGEWRVFQRRDWRHAAYVLGLLCFGVGAGVVAGLFPEDLPGAIETTAGRIHGIGAGLGFLALIACPLWAAAMDELSRLRLFNIAGFVVAAATVAVFLFAGKNPDALAGLWQRLNMLAIYAVLTVNALELRRSR